MKKPGRITRFFLFELTPWMIAQRRGPVSIHGPMAAPGWQRPALDDRRTKRQSEAKKNVAKRNFFERSGRSPQL